MDHRGVPPVHLVLDQFVQTLIPYLLFFLENLMHFSKSSVANALDVPVNRKFSVVSTNPLLAQVLLINTAH
jgi:hypothetical protein